VVQVVEHLPSKLKVPEFNPQYCQKRKIKDGREGGRREGNQVHGYPINGMKAIYFCPLL
jgi:hypothetical protein